jgi:hypothetical protein
MSNLKVQIAGTIYQINEKAFRTTGWNREPITPYFYASYVAAGQLVKQWVKKNYPNVVCRVKGDSFANGNSMHVNVSNPDGQMMSQQGSKITILHVERNGISVGMHRQCHNTSCCMHTSVQLKMLGNTHKQLKRLLICLQHHKSSLL